MKIQIDKDIRTPKQYSKVWTSRWQLFCMFWVSIYLTVDLIYNKGSNINNILVLLISSIVATVIPYFVKSYLETKEEKKNEIDIEKLNRLTDIEILDSCNETSDNKGVG